MQYSEFVEAYEALGKTSGRLDKVAILSEFLEKLHKHGKSKWIYLLKGKVAPDYDSREFGISTQLTLKAISHSFGANEKEVKERFNKFGDLGEVAEFFSSRKRQAALFSSKLSVERVFTNFEKIMSIEGKGTVGKKMDLISDVLNSASGKEAKYIIRTLLNDLRVGVADGVIKDAIASAFLKDVEGASEIVESAYDLANDFVEVLDKAVKGKKSLEGIGVVPGRAMNVMLAVKVTSIHEAFEACGKPAAIEHKYDGFRMMINKNNGKIFLFTRRLENVTHQFPDVVKAVEKYVKGESFILDSEVVGYDKETKKYMPFEAISQRIKRKYDIEKIIEKLPVEVNIFDVVYYNGKSFMNAPFIERRKIVEKIVNEKEWVIRPAMQIITGDEKKAEEFYKNALKIGEEGIMVKNINASYKQGRRVGYMVKMKPEVNDLDLVIVGAEYGTGKRGGWLTSYTVACWNGDRFVEVGKVSSGLKELESEGMTYAEMTEMLKPLIIEKKKDSVSVKPKIVVAVTYQNVQKSPSYSSGYALRFPRITAYRPDKPLSEITTLKEIEKEVKKAKR